MLWNLLNGFVPNTSECTPLGLENIPISLIKMLTKQQNNFINFGMKLLIKITLIALILPKIATAPLPTSHEENFWTLQKMEIHDPTPFSPKALFQFMQKQGIKNAEIVLRQAIQETGHFQSLLFKQYNNPFGLKIAGKTSKYYNGSDKAGYGKFRHWKYAVMAYLDYQKAKIANGFNLTDYYAFLQKSKYAEDPEYSFKLKRINISRYL